ncbi:MAG: EAL domain-containing protein [Betaproteobacteria bacterium]
MIKAVDGWGGLVFGPLLLVSVFLALNGHLRQANFEREEQQAIQNAITDNVNIATVVKVNLEQVLSKTAIYADLAAALINGQGNVAGYLNPTLVGDRAFLRIAVLDQQGKLLYSSARQKNEPELTAFAKEATQNFTHLPGAGTVDVGRPKKSNESWRIPVLVGIKNAGQKRGMLVAILDLGYFLQSFREVSLGQGGRIEVIDTDGYQLVEANGTTLSAGIEFKGTDFLEFLNKAPAGSGLISRADDHAKMVVAYYRIENSPLIVVVSSDYNSILALLKRQQNSGLWWFSFLYVFIFVGAICLVMMARRQRNVHRALAQSERKNLLLIEQLKDESQRAFQLASHDHLTGLPNRIMFSKLAASHLSRARRSRRYHAILFIDLDRFKTINDSQGHGVGDLLLQEVAVRLRSCLRESDVAARFGGDEFIILINEVDTVEAIEKIVKKIVNVVSEPYVNLDGQNVETSPSIGIALYPRDGEEVEVLLKHADAAMYLAKAAGRGTYRFYDSELNRQALRQYELLQGLRSAIRKDELVLHYQPRLRIKDSSLSGLEALVRWNHPKLGMIFPNDFIPLAEQHDLIDLLGFWVIDAVCRQLNDWRKRGVPLVPVAINISTKQFRGDNLVTDILAALKRHGVPAQLMEIEITESCLVEEPDRVARILTVLAEHGVIASMDDYGTGFASIGYLKVLPLCAIKIDRSFIREIHNHSSDEMIVSSITTLAQNLGLKVVAEGVETRDQLIHLKTIGCDQVQGYYFCRPCPPEIIEAVLQEGKIYR